MITDKEVAVARRAEIEIVLNEDARRYPDFAVARNSAVLAAAESQLVFSVLTTTRMLYDLHKYEMLRGGQDKPSKAALEFAGVAMCLVYMQAYERARKSYGPGERRHAYRSDVSRVVALAVSTPLAQSLETGASSKNLVSPVSTGALQVAAAPRPKATMSEPVRKKLNELRRRHEARDRSSQAEVERVLGANK